jgi:hypothetical protein
MSFDNYYTATINAKARRNDLVRRADQNRLASIARQNRPGMPIYRPVMDNVGSALVRLGLELKERAGAVVDMEPAPGPRTRIAG